jgi:hypothetical protein
VTLSGGLPATTLWAGPFWPPFGCLPAAVAQDNRPTSLVGPYTIALVYARASAHYGLPPYSLHSAKIGSVMLCKCGRIWVKNWQKTIQVHTQIKGMQAFF